MEIVCPVEDEQIKKEVMHILDVQMKDNVKASILQADGTYVKPDKRGKVLVNSQEYFCKEATERAEKPKEQENSRVFVPAEPVEKVGNGRPVTHTRAAHGFRSAHCVE